MIIVIFDNDGVLMKSTENYSEKLIRDYNLNRDEVNNFFIEIFVPYCLTGELDLKKELSKVFPKWGISDSVDLILKKWFEFESNFDSKIVKLILKLKSKGIKCYLATNNEKYRTKYLIEKLDYKSLFDGIFSSSYIGHKKPSKEFYEHVLSKISSEISDRNDVLYVDDDEKNVLAAKEFGINVFHYKKFKELEKELKRLQFIEK